MGLKYMVWPGLRSVTAAFLCVLLMGVAIGQLRSTGKRSGPSLSMAEGPVCKGEKGIGGSYLRNTL